jgi:pilus assembly protein Flp/PilA
MKGVWLLNQTLALDSLIHPGGRGRQGAVSSTVLQEKGMKNFIRRFVREQEGQDLIEYAFLAVFIALVVTAGLQAVAGGLNSQFSNIGTQVSSGS